MRFKQLAKWTVMTVCVSTISAVLYADEAASAAKPAGGAAALSEAEEAAMKEEIAYINALVGANLPDIAQPIIEAAKKKWPAVGPKLKVLENEGELRLGHFEKVQKVIDAIKDKKSGEYWGLRLAMADAYYARGKMPECAKIYREFFKAVPTPGPDIKDFYIEAGFKWAQMLIIEKKFDDAIVVYRGLLKQKLPETAWCSIASDDTELLIRLAGETKDEGKKTKYLDEASKLADQLLWKNEMIIIFGRAISLKAHIELMRGKPEKAQELVSNYMDQLSTIHTSLKEQDPDGKLGYVRMSPMPQCRYLLAKMLWDTVQEEMKAAKPDKAKITDMLLGKKVNGKRSGEGAWNHALNVFVNNPESTWAASAGELVEEINRFALNYYKRDFKAAAKISPDQMKKVRQMQFRNAFEVYRSGEYANAVKAYDQILAQFPEIEESIVAAANLAECYLCLWKSEKDKNEKEFNALAAEAVEGYVAERFAGKKGDLNRAAGDQVLRLAVKEQEMGRNKRVSEIYDMYFDVYQGHYQAAQMAMSLAGQAWKTENWEKAIKYYNVIATTYTNSTFFADSLRMLSLANGKLGNADAEIDYLRAFASAAKRPTDRAASQLTLALMQQKRGFAFLQAAETNKDEAAVADLKKQGAVNVLKSAKDFNAVIDTATKAIDGKYTSKDDKAKFIAQREMAYYLCGDSYQRLTFPEKNISVFRKRAVDTFEKYLELYPKGKYAPQALVKIGTIHTAEKNMEKSKEAFARLAERFPNSDEAKNSVPRLAKTLIEMGLKNEGVETYAQMLKTSGAYTARQFLDAGDALLEAKSWDTARAAFQKAAELAQEGTNVQQGVVARAALGQAKVLYKSDRLAEAHEALDAFIANETYSRMAVVVDAYYMLIDVASAEGQVEKDDTLRMKYFNAAVGALKKVRRFRPEQAQQDILDLESGDVLVRKMEAEESMGLKEQARETRARAVVTFQAFLMAHEPSDEHPASQMTPAQLTNLERCYSTALPLMAALGKEQAELVLKYGNNYLALFPDGKHKTKIENAMNMAKAE